MFVSSRHETTGCLCILENYHSCLEWANVKLCFLFAHSIQYSQEKNLDFFSYSVENSTNPLQRYTKQKWAPPSGRVLNLWGQHTCVKYRLQQQQTQVIPSQHFVGSKRVYGVHSMDSSYMIDNGLTIDLLWIDLTPWTRKREIFYSLKLWLSTVAEIRSTSPLVYDFRGSFVAYHDGLMMFWTGHIHLQKQ